MKCREDYIGLLELYVRVVDATQGIAYDDSESWKGKAGPFAVKLGMHLLTVLYLADGTRSPQIGSKRFEFVDHPSINVITRSAIETFLAFHFLIVAPNTPEERNFRLRVWELGGLKERQRFPATSPESQAAHKQVCKQLEFLTKQIENDPKAA